MNNIILTVVALLGAFFPQAVKAEDAALRIDSRPGVTVPLFVMKRANAIATLVMLPGGSGGYGQLVDGKPSGRNFLVRARDYFADAGFNVAVMGRPSDTADLDYADRIAPAHMDDIKAVVTFLKNNLAHPVWLIGTSRGSVSATAAAIVLGQEQLAGIVLTASVISPNKPGAVPAQDLAKIKIPVLVVHHENDACKICSPAGVPAILTGLKNASIKKLVMMKGGGPPTGDTCEALHFHGFIGLEKQVANLITTWIIQPSM